MVYKMEYRLTSLLIGLLIHAEGQHLYNTEREMGQEPLMEDLSVPSNYKALGPASSESMRALLDISRHPDVSYEEFYNSFPYYDILDYLYVEDENATTDESTSQRTLDTGSQEDSGTKSKRGSLSAKTETQIFLRNNKQNQSIPVCDAMTHFGCDVTRFERCDSLSQTCKCINSYIKETDPITGDTLCTAAKYLHGHMSIPVPNRKVKTLSAQGVQILRTVLQDYIKYLMAKYSIGRLLELRMRTSGERSQENPSVLVLSYEIAIAEMDQSVPTMAEKLRDLLHKELRKTPQNQGASEELVKIIGSTSTSSRNLSGPNVFTSLIDVNPCGSSEHTYCDVDAACRVENGSQTCRCGPGFHDTSPDPARFPGEVCEELCQCENQGVCVSSPVNFEVTECSCMRWYFGSRCQINGKELLIICSSSLASLIVIIICICCCYHACRKQRDRELSSGVFRFTPDTSIFKLPRVWMESWSHDKGISPQSTRRMSIATECNPYFDGYVLEDIPPNCVHLDRSEDYYTPPHQATLGKLPSAATVSSHSIVRHY